MPDERERRRAHRVMLDPGLGVKVDTSRVTIVDVSETGAKIQHTFPLSRGKKIMLEFQSDGEKVALECEVLRCKLEKHLSGAIYRSGLRFHDPEGGTANALRDLLADVITRDIEARHAFLIRIR